MINEYRKRTPAQAQAEYEVWLRKRGTKTVPGDPLDCGYTLAEQIGRTAEIARDIKDKNINSWADVLDEYKDNYDDMLLLMCDSHEDGVKVRSCKIIGDIIEENFRRKFH